MYVFRFEDKNGIGPFMKYEYYDAFNSASNSRGGKKIDVQSMPTPLSERECGSDLYKHARDYSFKKTQAFCFYDLEQVLKYFGCKKGLEAMAKEGCHLYVYEVNEKYVKRGHHQAVFHKTKAKKICKLVYEGLGGI